MMQTLAQGEMRVVVIPAKSSEENKQAAKCLRVAAYCRVSTDDEEQKTSYEAQIGYYTEKSIKIPNGRWRGSLRTREFRVLKPKTPRVP